MNLGQDPERILVENPIYIYIYIYFHEGPSINIKFYCDHFINLISKIPCWKILEEKNLSKDVIMNKRAHTCILIRRSPLGLQRNRFFVKFSWTFLTSSRSSGVPASGSNSQICLPRQLLRLYSHGPCPSATLSIHILHICLYIYINIRITSAHAIPLLTRLQFWTNQMQNDSTLEGLASWINCSFDGSF